MDAATTAVIAAFLLAFGLGSRLIQRTPVTGPMVFVAFGLVIGEPGFDLVRLELDSAGVELLAEATLALLLFSDAVRIDVVRLREEFALPARMLGLGLPLAIGFGTLAAALLFDIPAAVAALIAAILAPTDAALGQPVVTDEAIPPRIRQSLNVESGLNDGVALPAVTLFVALAADADTFQTAGSWIAFAAEQIGYGLGIGLLVGGGGGALIRRASAHDWMDGVYRQLAVLALAGLAFIGSVEIGGNGFIATFIAGLALGTTARAACAHVEEFTEDLAQLLATASFIVFGAIVVGPALGQLDWRIAAYAVVSLAVVRPVSIAISLTGAGLQRPTIAFLGWFGPRGLASILFGLSAVEHAHGVDLDLVFAAMSWTVLLSIVAHGATAAIGARAYGRWWAGMDQDEVMAEEIPMSPQRPPRG